MCAEIVHSGKRSSVTYQGASSGFEDVTQAPPTFKIKTILKTEVQLTQNTRLLLFLISCWIFWPFPRTHSVKELKDTFS